MRRWFHLFYHLFSRELVWEMVEMGGRAWGLRCKVCKHIDWIDPDRGDRLSMKMKAVHTVNYDG